MTTLQEETWSRNQSGARPTDRRKEKKRATHDIMAASRQEGHRREGRRPIVSSEQTGMEKVDKADPTTVGQGVKVSKLIKFQNYSGSNSKLDIPKYFFNFPLFFSLIRSSYDKFIDR